MDGNTALDASGGPHLATGDAHLAQAHLPLAALAPGAPVRSSAQCARAAAASGSRPRAAHPRPSPSPCSSHGGAPSPQHRSRTRQSPARRARRSPAARRARRTAANVRRGALGMGIARIAMTKRRRTSSARPSAAPGGGGGRTAGSRPARTARRSPGRLGRGPRPTGTAAARAKAPVTSPSRRREVGEGGEEEDDEPDEEEAGCMRTRIVRGSAGAVSKRYGEVAKRGECGVVLRCERKALRRGPGGGALGEGCGCSRTPARG